MRSTQISKIEAAAAVAAVTVTAKFPLKLHIMTHNTTQCRMHIVRCEAGKTTRTWISFHSVVFRSLLCFFYSFLMAFISFVRALQIANSKIIRSQYIRHLGLFQKQIRNKTTKNEKKKKPNYIYCRHCFRYIFAYIPNKKNKIERYSLKGNFYEWQWRMAFLCVFFAFCQS